MPLTESQLQVVNYPYHPASTLKVIAHPGSGKTVTLLHRVYHLIKNGTVKPEEILILSLTNKAIENVIEKLLEVFELLDTQSNNNQNMEDRRREIVSQIGVYTIHGLANRIVTEHDGITDIIEESGWRGMMNLLPAEFWRMLPSSVSNPKIFESVYRNYMVNNIGDKTLVNKISDILKSCNVLTNDDLISKAAVYLNQARNLGEINPTNEFTKSLLEKTKIVMIDEFQDLYTSLTPLLREVSTSKRLELYGDVNQSIYGFMGDNKKVMSSLENLHRLEIRTLKLNDNFRSTPEISLLADTIANSTSRTNAVTKLSNVKKPSGTLPISVKFRDLAEELDFVVEQIAQAVSSSAKLSDIAILARSNAKVDLIGNHLRSYGIPATKLTSNPNWLDNKRIQFVIDLMRMIYYISNDSVMNANGNRNWKSNFSLIVVLSSLKQVGTASIQKLYNVCQRNNSSIWNYLSPENSAEWPIAVNGKPIVQSFQKEIEAIANKETLDSLSTPELLLLRISEISKKLETKSLDFTTAKETQLFEESFKELYKVMKSCYLTKPEDVNLLEWFLQTYYDQSLDVNATLDSEQKLNFGSIKLSTIHSSKGLEFPIVFLIGDKIGGFDKDRNLLYVGVTRARNLLYMTNVEFYNKHTKVVAKEDVKDIMKNAEFWKYYNEDLKRRNISTEAGYSNFHVLQQKYLFNCRTKMYYSTCSIKSLFRIYRKVPPM